MTETEISCQHDWRRCSDGWEEQCIPYACKKCGTRGCLCDVRTQFNNEHKLQEEINRIDKLPELTMDEVYKIRKQNSQ